MPLYIPESHKELLQKYSQVSEEKRKEILSFLNSEEVYGASFDDLSIILSNRLSELNLNFAKLVEVFFSINRSFSVLKMDKEKFVDQVIASLKIENVKLDNNIKQDLLFVLNSSLSIRSKSIDLFLDNEKTVTNVRILTDIRPIFNNDKDVKINAGIIIHTLKIEYKDSTARDNTFFVAFQPDELNTLKEQISRAQSKEEFLKQTLENNLKLIELKL